MYTTLFPGEISPKWGAGQKIIEMGGEILADEKNGSLYSWLLLPDSIEIGTVHSVFRGFGLVAIRFPDGWIATYDDGGDDEYYYDDNVIEEHPESTRDGIVTGSFVRFAPFKER